MNKEKESSKGMAGQGNCPPIFYEMEVHRLSKSYEFTDEEYKDQLRFAEGLYCGLTMEGMGFFPTKESALMSMEALQNDSNNADIQFYICIIREKEMDRVMECGSYLKEWTYYNGKLLDESIVRNCCEEKDPFLGRPQEKIRFRHGDIVTVPSPFGGKWGIVYDTPPTEERAREYIERLGIFALDWRNDSYVILESDEGFSSHDDVPAHYVLPVPPQGVPPFVEKTLREGLRKAEKQLKWNP